MILNCLIFGLFYFSSHYMLRFAKVIVSWFTNTYVVIELLKWIYLDLNLGTRWK
jgi:hypothetical protein